MSNNFFNRLVALEKSHEDFLCTPNVERETDNGVFERYKNPVLTATHTPVIWRYDLNPATNPFLMERVGINAVFNPGAIKWKNKYVLVARVEAANRKSFFALAESDNGIDNFRFHDSPIVIPETTYPDTNIYDMRLVEHQDGWVYGIFCTERKDPNAPDTDHSSAIAQCGIIRTKDLLSWERLPDLVTPSPQQRNVVLHPELVNGKYFFYTRPQDGFIKTGKGGGIGYGLADNIANAVIEKEFILDAKIYHTVYELKNGLGPAPIKTKKGWLHLAHGVRNTAAGLRYVLYLFMTDLKDLTRIIHKPAGYFLAPEGEERIGDVSNVVFSNGWIADEDGTVFIYYASSDTKIHLAKSSIERLLDYVINTPEDGFTSLTTINTIMEMVEKNKSSSPEKTMDA